MNQDWNQNQNWNQNQDWNQNPYIVNPGYQQDKQNLISQVASKSFLIVFLGLIVTTISAYLTVNSVTLLESLCTNRTWTIVCIVELAVVWISSFAIKKKALGLAAGLFALYTILNGITLSVIFLIFDIGTVQEAFFMTTLMFGALTAYGYFTKRDLTKVGAICGMALFGAIIVSLLNLFFFHSTGMDLLMDYLVVAIFVGLTAYDMWRMKQQVMVTGPEEANRIALFTGIQLYLDFINLFIRLVSILGRKK
ncbi:MAG: Bax inhibitor-1/YccA family protein [Clostridiales bacterium]|nr:Bax inhibitor-1/YccA family protein [Clostridiales bacterium]